jgi:ankyrin repeat protein
MIIDLNLYYNIIILHIFLLIFIFNSIKIFINSIMGKIDDELKEALKNEDIKKMKELLKKGAKANYSFKNKDKELSLLHMAIFFEDMPYVKLLVENGADVNKFEYVNGEKNQFGNLSPLQYSILNGSGELDNFKIIKYLLEKEANPYLKNKLSTNSRDIAKYRKKKDNNKKYLDTIDTFYKKNKKSKDKLIEEANKSNYPSKKNSVKTKKKSNKNIKDNRKQSLKGGKKKKSNKLLYKLLNNINNKKL